jgi:NADH:ubiquinone oxidoreductase subunit 5 (subunit L)/multisubunit Na+/H+ antiporter MnhA subunit
MNFDIYTLLLISLALCGASAVLSILTGSKKQFAGWLNFLLIGAASAVLIMISIKVLTGPESSLKVMDLGVLKLSFLIDGLSALFLLVIAVPSFVTALYSIKYMDHYEDYKAGP